MTTALYDYCGAFFAELAAQEVGPVFISPGSRSTPLTLCASLHPQLTTHVVLDERSAAFAALGAARATGRTSVLVCTSGTAAANYAPAVAEAHFSGVPLLVLTADRPPELWGWGAGQTIAQNHMYPGHTRWFAQVPVPSEAAPGHARRMASRAVAEASSPTGAGPVHLNWPIREPLEPPPGFVAPVLDTPISTTRSAAATPPETMQRLTQLLAQHERGLFVVGPLLPGADTELLVTNLPRLAASAGWPVLADAASQLRQSAEVLHHSDLVLKSPAVDDLFASADVVVRFGATPVSKSLRLRLEATPPPVHLLVDPGRRWEDPSFTFTEHHAAQPGALVASAAADFIAPERSDEWRTEWTASDAAAASAVDSIVNTEPLLQAGVSRTLGARLPASAVLYASNSMPVRDIEDFVGAAACEVHANRGANGIDGLTSSAAGVAATTGRPTVLLLGDLALLHDLGGLVTALQLGGSLTLVVPNNDGGGIFSHLPIASHPDEVSFERVFHTPHGLDLAAVVSGIGNTRVHEASNAAALATTLGNTLEQEGVDVVLIPVDHNADMDQRRRIQQAVNDALGT
jgi:2-succinyl-5-enolpyruvyl-6-hydroxy-3-cyclohexene-1-carboxylate synthase